MDKLLENWRKYLDEDFNLGKPTSDIEYTAYVLHPDSRQMLAELVPLGWEMVAHHMTVISPPEMKRRLPSRWLDWKDCVTIVAIAENEQVIAGKVDLGDVPLPMRTDSIPHITIAINPQMGGKPMMAKDFTKEEYEMLEEPIEVCGQVEEVSREA